MLKWARSSYAVGGVVCGENLCNIASPYPVGQAVVPDEHIPRVRMSRELILQLLQRNRSFLPLRTRVVPVVTHGPPPNAHPLQWCCYTDPYRAITGSNEGGKCAFLRYPLCSLIRCSVQPKQTQSAARVEGALAKCPH